MGRVRAPPRVRGPLGSHSPSYSGSLPLLHGRVFAAGLPCGTPTGTPSRPKPRDGWQPVFPQGPGGSRVRSCYLPGSRLRLPPAAFVAFPPTRFQSSGYSGTAWAQRTPGGTDSEQSGSCTRPVTGLAIVRPSLSEVSRASSLPQPPGGLPHPQHRPAPHASTGYGFTRGRGGDSHPLSQDQPQGFLPP